MVPTLTATLGVKGHRPVVGTRDCKHLLYVFAVVNVITAALHANTLDSPKDAKAKTGRSKTRRLQDAFAARLCRSPGRTRPTGTGGWSSSSTTPRGTAGRQSTRRWRTTRTWRSTGCQVTARASTRSSSSGRSSGGGRPTTGYSTPRPT
nr:hypothetical protein [Limnoglobus roseus]